jgi:hypothetical protein
MGLEIVAHRCNLRYSGGRDQEGCGLRPEQEVNEILSQKTNKHKKNQSKKQVWYVYLPH